MSGHVLNAGSSGVNQAGDIFATKELVLRRELIYKDVYQIIL